MKASLVSVCAFCFLAAFTWAQSPGPTPAPQANSPSASPQGSSQSQGGISNPAPFLNWSGKASPQPYQAGEFSTWAKDLRRFEIISIGALPWGVFYSNLVFDLSRYLSGNSFGFSFANLSLGANPFTHTGGLGSFNSIYAPWPFKSATSYASSDDEEALVLLSAISLSIIIGIVDYAIVKAKQGAKQRRQALLRSKALNQADEIDALNDLGGEDSSADADGSADAGGAEPESESSPNADPLPSQGGESDIERIETILAPDTP